MATPKKHIIAVKSLTRLVLATVHAAFAIGTVQAAIPTTERSVLDALYANTGGSSWSINTGWETSANECTWYGIECDVAGDHVTEISVAGNNLSGTLPDISALTALLNFDVGENHLHGAIPALTSLVNLQFIEAQDNQLSGPVPSLSGLTALQNLDIQNNALSGNAPDLGSLTSLIGFVIGGNRLTGPVPAPPPVPVNELNAVLCANFFNPPSNPESATDQYWDGASVSDSWYDGCTRAPVVDVTPVSVPLFAPISTLLLISLLGMAGGLAVRYRTVRFNSNDTR